MKKIIITFSILFYSLSSQGQILISLLLGDKLNSDKLEFGLDGGVNFSSLSGVGGSSVGNFNLGFYFDFKTKHKWMIHTGVIVKSSLGAKGIAPYFLNNPDLDNAFIGGEVERKLNYFNVPVLIKRSFDNHFSVEGGIQLGLMHKASDEFKAAVNQKDDLTYKVDIKDQYHPLDAGLVAGIGYRLLKGKGMHLSLRYYYGLVDVTIDDSGTDVYNRSMYLNVGIPIGAGKKKSDE
jgi:hypothetical protein